MNKQEFIKYIESPELLSKPDLSSMDELLNRFPYCQSLQLMKAKALHESKSVLFDQQLTKAAAYAGNRKVLYYLIHDDQHEISTLVEEDAKAFTKAEDFRKPALEIENILDEREDEKQVFGPDFSEQEFSAELEVPQSSFEEGILPETEPVIEDIPEQEEPIENIHKEEQEISEESVGSEKEKIPEQEEIVSGMPWNDEDDDTKDQSYPEGPAKMQTFTFGGWLRKINGELVENALKEKPRLLIRLDTNEEIQPLVQDEIGELILTNVYQEGYLLKEEMSQEVQSSDSPKENIIEKFIKADIPGIIKFRSDDQSSSAENKARQSANEQSLPITETLAQIYLRQKLYRKALEAYEKLSLKYPEKKTYFANLIEKIKSGNI